ncbi:hypothetical protein F2O61_04525 [Staphylococcus pseudintermedius]|uniref:Uncharacterized protein n=1 Tax=Staphylococcus pseudintermedius TaxID=283734 RepID=A0A8H9EQD0_STAPS|nr:hypothetical protein [Staphylococcus pseudintermedius]EGQ3150125.1 hypothetical protein [Staphylococcus pseudintermedius]EGQ3621648.1 hypothetical protein [Staphylococcus pseudintermedius]EGQ3972581.1 hypothetical protein [Staphylococcus pseudintermedius]EGQ4058040.1 hypothetical protein [Staphylococcus pseudintermedius]EGQ4065625.1 hypothetical protein [Staphylococcus pseudintermedius]
MKIKVKKEMNLLELIEYIKKNEIADKVFFDKKGKGKVVVGDDRHLYMTDLNLTETFTVEIDEEITEETEILILVELFVSDYGLIIHTYYRTSIREAIGEVVKGVDTLPKAFYILNDDYTMTLIWEDGEMVE